MWPSMSQQRNKGPGAAGGPPKDNLGADDDSFGYLRTQQIPELFEIGCFKKKNGRKTFEDKWAYGSLTNTTNMNENPYLAPAGNYYPFPYGLGDGNTAWSSGGEPVFSFSSYGHAGNLGHAGNMAQTNDHHTSMYGATPGADFGSSFGYSSHPAAPGFSFFPTAAGEYDTWGTGGGRNNKAYDDYYHTRTAQHSMGQLTSATTSNPSTGAGPFDYGAMNGDTGFTAGSEGLKNLEQTMGGLSMGGEKNVLPISVSGVGDHGNLVSPKDLFAGGIVGVAGGNVAASVGSGDHGGLHGHSAPPIGAAGGIQTGHAPILQSSNTGVLGETLGTGPGGLGTSGGVGGLISGSHVNNSTGPVASGGGGGGSGANVAPQPPAPAPSGPPAKKSWASIASQPAKPQPKVTKTKTTPPAPVLVTRNAGNMDIGTWGETSARSSSGERGGGREGRGDGGKTGAAPAGAPRNAWGTTAPRQGRSGNSEGSAAPGNAGGKTRDSGNVNNNGSGSPPTNGKSGGFVNNGPNAGTGPDGGPVPPVLKELMGTHKYNPKDYNLNPKSARFFVIKSYSEDDIHRSIKYGIWCSTEHGNKRLDEAFRTQESKGPVLLFYSVNGSGHFCGMAQMMGSVDYDTSARVWLQDKWKGKFEVKWIYVKDVPNSQLRHIRLENNENKPVTNSRDTQEILGDKGKQVLKIIHTYKHSTSIFDDFGHYEKRQEVETFREPDASPVAPPPAGPNGAAAGAPPHADHRAPAGPAPSRK